MATNDTPTPASAVDEIAAAAAIVHIQQLAIRYAQGIDARDLERVADVFVPDVDCGHFGRGRDALIKMYQAGDSTMGTSIHRVSTHRVDLIDESTATGVVYLTAEHQQHDGSWARLMGAYHDHYVRLDGRWQIRERRLLFWYHDSDALPPTTRRSTDYRVFAAWGTLPSAWPTWDAFWAEIGDDRPVHRSVRRDTNS